MYFMLGGLFIKSLYNQVHFIYNRPRANRTVLRNSSKQKHRRSLLLSNAAEEFAPPQISKNYAREWQCAPMRTPSRGADPRVGKKPRWPERGLIHRLLQDYPEILPKPRLLLMTSAEPKPISCSGILNITRIFLVQTEYAATTEA